MDSSMLALLILEQVRYWRSSGGPPEYEFIYACHTHLETGRVIKIKLSKSIKKKLAI